METRKFIPQHYISLHSWTVPQLQAVTILSTCAIFSSTWSWYKTDCELSILIREGEFGREESEYSPGLSSVA